MGIDIENLTVLDIFKLGQFCLLKTIGPPPFKSVAQICKSLNISLEDLPFHFSSIQHSNASPELSPTCSKSVIKLYPLHCLKFVSIASFFMSPRRMTVQYSAEIIEPPEIRTIC
jgi:hypothetical protein